MIGIESVLLVLLWIVIFFAIAYVAHWVITAFFPEPLKTPALLIVGVILLILIILLLLNYTGVPLRR